MPQNNSQLVQGSEEAGWGYPQDFHGYANAVKEIRRKHRRCRPLAEKQRWPCGCAGWIRVVLGERQDLLCEWAEMLTASSLYPDYRGYLREIQILLRVDWGPWYSYLCDHPCAADSQESRRWRWQRYLQDILPAHVWSLSLNWGRLHPAYWRRLQEVLRPALIIYHDSLVV